MQLIYADTRSDELGIVYFVGFLVAHCNLERYSARFEFSQLWQVAD
jgi:hypothetical protein